MKNANKTKLVWLTVCLVCGIISINGCKKEHGRLNNQTELLVNIRNQYIGTFSGHEPCSITGTENYQIYIAASDTDSAAVRFNNLWNAHSNTTGLVNADGNIYISRQSIGYTSYITGRAMILGEKIVVSYSIEDSQFGGNTDNCIWQQQ